MQGVCVDAGGSTNLKVGSSYYLFEHSAGHYYASRFNTPRSFFGIYRKMLFSEVKEVAEPLHNNVSPSNEKLAKKNRLKKLRIRNTLICNHMASTVQGSLLINTKSYRLRAYMAKPFIYALGQAKRSRCIFRIRRWTVMAAAYR